MIDRSTTRSWDEVPEADYVEQSVPAYPDPAADSDERDLAAQVDRDAFSANPADVVEQSIAVPLDDEDRADIAPEPGPEYAEEI
ncbi:hypothetical protein ACFVMC_23570 [Nocardia sp. NPDC127579]|uniref:hypothetical protein n=1 Tax=Nocardia sp. NPDC127579 TaxID=3345402 RepID=UPI0036299098